MKGLLALFIVIITSISATMNSGKELSELTIGGILFAFAGFIALILIATSGRKVSYAEANHNG